MLQGEVYNVVDVGSLHTFSPVHFLARRCTSSSMDKVKQAL